MCRVCRGFGEVWTLEALGRTWHCSMFRVPEEKLGELVSETCQVIGNDVSVVISCGVCPLCWGGCLN